jgi:hypothetical protein
MWLPKADLLQNCNIFFPQLLKNLGGSYNFWQFIQPLPKICPATHMKMNP